MNDILKTIEPKSDQLNADDLIGGRSITVRVSKVDVLAGEQPVSLHFEGGEVKPYKPCKSMRRVLVNAWRTDVNLWVGRSLTLYCDPAVVYGGVAVGGIRISHMSDIDSEITMALTAKRGSRKPYSVLPLKVAPNKDHIRAAPDPSMEQLGHDSAAAGTEALKTFWSARTASEKQFLGGAPQLDSWKLIAADADAGMAAREPGEEG
jgi:hypothetical protein